MIKLAETNFDSVAGSLNSNILKYYSFTATTDSNGIVTIPQAICKPSTQHLVSSLMDGGGFALGRYFLDGTNDKYDLMLFDNIFEVYSNRSFGISIIYTDI